MKAWRGFGQITRDSINDLDCVNCGGWFHSFGALAEHMKSGECMTRPRKEKKPPMAKLPKATGHTEKKDAGRAMTGRIPKADRSQAGGDLPPFLKAENIGDVGAGAKLALTGEARVAEGQFGEQIIVNVKYNSKVFAWGVKLNSPNHRLLEDRVGSDTAKWKGKSVAVTVRENLGHNYIAINR